MTQQANKISEMETNLSKKNNNNKPGKKNKKKKKKKEKIKLICPTYRCLQTPLAVGLNKKKKRMVMELFLRYYIYKAHILSS